MFKIEKKSKTSLVANKNTSIQLHMVTFVKPNTIIRQKDKGKKINLLTNDKMSKKTNKITFLHKLKKAT